MILADDSYGEFSTCITCGYVYEAPVLDAKEFLKEARLAGGNPRRREPSHGKLRL